MYGYYSSLLCASLWHVFVHMDVSLARSGNTGVWVGGGEVSWYYGSFWNSAPVHNNPPQTPVSVCLVICSVVGELMHSLSIDLDRLVSCSKKAGRLWLIGEAVLCRMLADDNEDE